MTRGEFLTETSTALALLALLPLDWPNSPADGIDCGAMIRLDQWKAALSHLSQPEDETVGTGDDPSRLRALFAQLICERQHSTCMPLQHILLKHPELTE